MHKSKLWYHIVGHHRYITFAYIKSVYHVLGFAVTVVGFTTQQLLLVLMAAINTLHSGLLWVLGGSQSDMKDINGNCNHPGDQNALQDKDKKS